MAILAQAYSMILRTVASVFAMTALKLTVDGKLQTFRGTYVGAAGAQATRHLAYASHPVPTDRHYDCKTVNLEGRWDVLEDLAAAIGDSPKTTLAIKIRTGVIRYCLSAGAFLECPGWKLDGDTKRELKGAEAGSEAIKTALDMVEGSVRQQLEATKADLEASRAACRKAEEVAEAIEAAAQHELKELKAYYSQTIDNLNSELENSVQGGKLLEASQHRLVKASQECQANSLGVMEANEAANKRLAISNSLISQLKGEVTQLKQRNQDLQKKLKNCSKSPQVAKGNIRSHNTKAQHAAEIGRAHV